MRRLLLLAVLLLGSSGPALAQGPDPTRAAMESRILQLEDEVRRLTGRVEELEYKQDQLTARMEKLVGSVDQRLSAVEPGRPAGAPSAGEGGPPAPAAPPPPAPPPVVGGGGDVGGPKRLTPTMPPPASSRAQATDVAPDASAAKGYVLGTIPRDAASNPPRAAEPAPDAAPATDVGYDGALSLLQSGKWDQAEQAFKGFLDKNPKDSRAPSASYWLAETYYFRKDYQDAAAAFARNYKNYGPDAPRAPDNLLKLGMSLAALGDKDKACQTYGELAKRHPNASAPVKQTLARERSSAGCPA